MKLLSAALLTAFAMPLSIAAAEISLVDAHLSEAKALRELARYPHWSRAIGKGEPDPLIERRKPTRQTGVGDPASGLALSVWSSAVSALPGDQVGFFAQVTGESTNGSDAEVRESPRALPIAARMQGRLTSEAGRTVAELTYRDDGRGPDATAGDGIFSASTVLPAAHAPPLGKAESLLLTVDASTATSVPLTALGGVLFSNPGALLTGRFTEAVRDGNLVIVAEADVLVAGRYHLAATLADATHSPVASAETAEELQPGRRWIELAYYGLAFHERAVAGPLTLGTATLTSADSMPNAFGPVLYDAYTTRPVSLKKLTRVPFDDALLLQKAQRLEHDIAIR